MVKEFFMFISFILVLTFLPLAIEKAYAGGLCTGFFISSDGYIGTAAHCYGEKMTALYIKDGEKKSKKAIPIMYNEELDTMLLKIEDHDLPFFSLSLLQSKSGDNLAYIGYPSPDTYGWFKHKYRGKVMYVEDTLIHADVWSAPGTSGSGVFNSNSAVVGVLTLGFTIFGIHHSTGIRPVQTLILQAIQSDVNITLDKHKPEEISDISLNHLYQKNRDKVVMVVSE